MQAKELMIGDWVRGTIDPDETWQWEAEDYLNIDEQEIEPIPLTEEILEKNGWTLLSNWNDEAYYSECGKFHLDFRYGKLRLIIHSRVIIVEYVHQLQHALRLCGLNEIADNFKV